MNLSDFVRRTVTAQVESLRVVTAVVTAVDAATATITAVPPGQPEMLGVRLRAVVTDKTGIVGYPAVGSQVAVALLDEQGTEAVVVAASELEWAEIRIGEKSLFTMAADGTVTFNDGSFGSLIQIQKLVDEMDKLNNQVKEIVRLLTNPTAWTVAPGDGGAALKAAAAITLAGLPAPTISVAQFENPDIKHGPHA